MIEREKRGRRHKIHKESKLGKKRELHDLVQIQAKGLDGAVGR